MKKNIFQVFFTMVMVFKTIGLQAQPIVTEYLVMTDTFQIDRADKRIQKIISTKGMIDIDWRPSKRLLEISYYLGQAKIEDIMQIVMKVAATPLPAVPKNEAKAMPVTPF